MLYGNEIHYNDVNLNLRLISKKKNENYCTAAAREIIAWSNLGIELMSHVLLEKEKSLCLRKGLKDLFFTFLMSKNCSYRSYD